MTMTIMASDRCTTMISRQQRNNQYQLLAALLLSAVIACSASSLGSSKSSFGIQQQRHNYHFKSNYYNEDLFRLLRGGSTGTAEASAKDDDDAAAAAPEVVEEVDNNDNDDEDEEAEDDNPLASVLSTLPVRLLIQTNWGNSVLDHRVELMAARTRTVGSLKKSVSRQLPGRPPILGLELVYEGRVLEDEMLVDELFDDDEEDEDEDEESSDEASKTLILNALPPVDPKFGTELAPKLKAHVENNDESLSTEELVDAFFLNQAAMNRNGQLLANPNTPTSPLLRLEIQEQAQQLREQLQSQIPEDVWESTLHAVRKSHHQEERRGQRYRSGKGGATTNLKQSLQHNLNIHWGETIRNCVLFLFFGYFGGRNSTSRQLMLLGAPLCFILQARPVKMYAKILFYMMSDPPGIIKSLLPAPQQAILDMDMKKSYFALYSSSTEQEEEKAPTASKSQAVEDEDEDESESEQETEDEEESESEDENEEDDDEDEED